jgi:tetraacyldisaccharide 4'-kinase
MKEYLYSLATDKKKGIIPGAIKVILLILSFVYGLIIRLMMYLSSLDLRRFDLRVISVGNITVGGTGKTSLVEFIASYLKKRGHRVAILTRGYKRKGADSLGDEPSMLLNNLAGVSVIVDKDRSRAAKRAVREYNCDSAILDDGMQQWRIKKDLEIVTIDAVNPFGNRHMLPRGILRQPLSSLKSADIFVLTKTDLAQDTGKLKPLLQRYNPKAAIVDSIHHPCGFLNLNAPGKMIEAGGLKGESAAILSGIGDPDSFSKIVRGLGVKVGLDLRFDDHHHYTSGELKVIAAKTRASGLGTIITTQKDASRLTQAGLDALEGLRVFILRIELKITKNEELLFNRLLKLYSL